MPAAPSGSAAWDIRRIVVPLQSNEVAAFDRDSGDLVWSTPIATSTVPVVVGDSVLVFAGGEITALAATTGDVLWSMVFDETVLGIPSIVDGKLIVLVSGGAVVSIDPATQRQDWRRQLTNRVPRAMATSSTTAYVTLPDGRLVALALADGRVLWERVLDAELSVAAIGRDRVYVGTVANTFHALSAANGTVAWSWDARRIGGDVIGAAVDGDTVYFAALDNTLRALNAGSGNQRWKQVLPSRPTLPPVTFGGLVLVSGVSPALAAFNARTGEAAQTLIVPTAVGASTPGSLQEPALVSHVAEPFRVNMAIVTRDGRLMGLRTTAMMFREAAPTPLPALPGRAVVRDALPATSVGP